VVPVADVELCGNDFRAEHGEPCVYSSRLRVNDGPAVAVCSWCGRVQGSDPRPAPSPVWLDTKTAYAEARRRRRRERQRDRESDDELR